MFIVEHIESVDNQKEKKPQRFLLIIPEMSSVNFRQMLFICGQQCALVWVHVDIYQQGVK